VKKLDPTKLNQPKPWVHQMHGYKEAFYGLSGSVLLENAYSCQHFSAGDFHP